MYLQPLTEISQYLNTRLNVLQVRLLLKGRLPLHCLYEHTEKTAKWYSCFYELIYLALIQSKVVLISTPDFFAKKL